MNPLPTSLPLDIKARQFGTNMQVEAAITQSHLRLKSPDGSIQITLDRALLPFAAPGHTVMMFFNCVMVAAKAEEPAGPLLLPDTGLVRPQ